MPATKRIEITQKTLGTYLKFTIRDSDGVPIDITGFTITFRMKDVDAAPETQPAVDSACVLSGTGIDPEQGQCKYTWVATNLDTTGDYYGSLKIVDGAKTYYTERDEIKIRVVENVDPDG